MTARSNILGKTVHRSATIERRQMNEQSRSIDLAFSSETPADQWFGREVLDHSNGAVDLSRLRSGAALLVNHNADDHVGVVVDARVDDDRRGRATVRFGNSARASEIWQDVKDGIRGLVSVGYRIKDVVVERGKGRNEPDTYRVTKWQPMEVSIVSVPADASVGVGRSAPNTPPKTPMKTEIDIEVIREEANRTERERVSEILEAGRRMSRHGKDLMPDAHRAVESGEPADSFRKRIFGLMDRTSPVADLHAQERIGKNIGMSEREVRGYSFSKAIMGAANGRLEGLEREASEAYERQIGQSPRTFWIPPDVIGADGTRDLTVGTGTQAGNLVATNLLGGSFIDLLRNRMVAARLGVTFMTGLVGNVTIPRQTATAGANWMASETASASEGDMTVDLVTLTPHTLHARQDLTKLLMQQSTPAAEQLVRNDLAQSVAIAIDQAVINGTNTAQPEGILNVSGIGSVATTGGDGGDLTWANVVELETDVAAANADMGSLAYLTRASIRGKLKSVDKGTDTGAYVWMDPPTPQTPGEGIVNGYRALVSNQVPNTLVEGTSSDLTAMIFGNWSDYIIAQWGGLDVLVNPYSQASTRIVEVHTHMFADGTVRHAESFSAAQDLTET